MSDPPDRFRRLALAVPVLCATLAACSDSNDATPAPADDGSGTPYSVLEGTRSLVGLYDTSFTLADGRVDIRYTELTDDADLILYDYRNDSVDLGANCYLVLQIAPVIWSGGNRYRLGSTDVTITRRDRDLLVRSLQSDPGADGGETTTGDVTEFIFLEGIDPIDLTLCSDSPLPPNRASGTL